jgi:hypothetical protein
VNIIAFFKNKTVISFIAALIVSTYIYVIVQHGQLYPVPFYLKPCSPSGASNVCNVPDNTSWTALYVNIIFVWFIYFFFYICCSIWEIFVDYRKSQEKESVKSNQ